MEVAFVAHELGSPTTQSASSESTVPTILAHQHYQSGRRAQVGNCAASRVPSCLPFLRRCRGKAKVLPEPANETSPVQFPSSGLGSPSPPVQQQDATGIPTSASTVGFREFDDVQAGPGGHYGESFHRTGKWSELAERRRVPHR